MKYEHKLAQGKTLDELSESMTEIAQIRDDEINEAIDKGLTLFVKDSEFFIPVGQLSSNNGLYTQVMRRMMD